MPACPKPRRAAGLFAAAVVLSVTVARAQTEAPPPDQLIARSQARRRSLEDLELGGDLTGLPTGTTRYLSREDLLALPQVTYTVTDDPNFTGPTEVSGVPLEDLMRALAGAPDADLVIAMCGDLYRSHYPRAYRVAHQPFLALKVNGQPPEGWPGPAEDHGLKMGPYVISHPTFKPRFKILAHPDEPQIAWGVVRLEFGSEKTIFGAIAPSGPRAGEPAVQEGYRIAQQNCLRCHDMGGVGGQKARRPWLVLSAWATASPEYFAAYVRNPRSRNPQAQMNPNPTYDDATLEALTAYFQTFSSGEKP
jgi:mono/diheme cytochrome c family protein